MKHILFTTLIFCVTLAHAQPTFYDSYTDEVIGWKKTYNYPPATKPIQVDDKTYSASQISVANLLANWMQMSYMPKGALGDVKKTVLPKLGLYNSYVKALPHSYGAVVYSYVFLKKDASNKWVNETTHANIWRIMANEVPNADYYGIPFLNNNKEFYFTIPDTDEQRWETVQENTKNHPVIKKYHNTILPDFGGASNGKLIILSKDNVFPFQQLTIGEVLSLCENSISNWFKVEKKKIAEANQYPGNKNMYKDYEFHLGQANEKAESAKQFLKELNKKYHDKSKQPAFLNNGKFDIADLANKSDIFSDGENNNYPVYKIKPELKAQCKTDKPQWITISWGGGTLPTDKKYKHFNESIINNFNYDYLYDYFFDNEKVKGKQYKSLK